jgi:hypothetical protein
MILNKRLRSLPIFFSLFLGLVILASPALSHAERSSYSVSAAENGQVLPPHPTPWEFHQDGRIEARGFWSGKWEMLENGDLQVRIIDNQGNRDRFIVRFEHHCRELKAYQNGTLFRVGQLISGDFCPKERFRDGDRRY